MKNSKKLHIIQMAPLDLGGISSLVLAVQDQLLKDDIIFDYLVFRNIYETFVDDKIAEQGGKKLLAESEQVSNSFLRGFVKFYRTYKVMKESGASIFHINVSTPYDVVSGVAAKLAGVETIIVHSHNSKPDDRKLRNMLGPFCKALMPMITNVYLACSEEAAEFMFPASVLKNKRYHIVKNGIDLKRFSYRPALREEFRGRYDCGDRLILGNIGRLHPQKNQRFLLEIMQEVLKQRPDALLYLIGVGELDEELKAYAGELGIKDSVVFFGPSDEIPGMLHMMDAFVMPSLYEGLPLTGVEAQAAGLPCFFSDTITRELELTENALYLPLEKDAAYWAEQVLEYDYQKPRRDFDKEIREQGFDIRTTALRLKRLYRKADEKSKRVGKS
ncbi:MAG: glycosyltransferase [Blautia sp.]|nr:glycosyltransferase [Blautia sp.]